MIIPEIEASQAFKDNGEIVIWNDETEGDQTVGSTAGFDGTEIIISPLAKGNAYTNDILYTHASDLVTLQDIFHVESDGPYLGGAEGSELPQRSVQAGRDPFRRSGTLDLGDDAARFCGIGRRRRLSPEARRGGQPGGCVLTR